MTRTGKSPRELESVVEDLEAETPTDDGGEERTAEYIAEARARWEADEYESGSIDQLVDAYTLAFADDESRDIPPILGALSQVSTLDVGGYGSWKPLTDLAPYDEPPEPPSLPPVPTEEVADALEEFGVARGIDVPALRRRHPDDWVEHFLTDLFFERTRHRIKNSAADWDEEKRRETQATIERWREALHAGEWPGSVEDGRWKVRPLEAYL